MHDLGDDRDASPITWLDRARVPLVLAWGGNDMPRVRRSNERAVALLHDAGIAAVSCCYPGLDYFETQLALADGNRDWYAQFVILRETPSGAG